MIRRGSAVVADDLSTPLGRERPRRRRVAIPIAIGPAFAACLGLSLAVFAGWTILADDPFGGEPMALAPAEMPADPGAQSDKPTVAPARQAHSDQPDPGSIAIQPATPKQVPNGKVVTIIDGTSGSRRDIVIPATAEAKTATERLSEPSRHGPLPKIAQDGARPAEAFARAVKPIPGKPDAPRVAIVIGGLGIGANGTGEALRTLPGPVTFAFAPYGSSLDRHVARARKAGHEVLLQVPMEPFDYPDNDPGPHTLLTSLDANQNIDRLHWLMSRFQGYVGIVNYMGGRFTASEPALAPVLREVAKRGLIYLDDGVSKRSLAGQIAGANNVAFTKADVIIDAVPSGADVDRALSRLEAAARAKGLAIGFASALPVAIDRIARWAKEAEARGIQLVPITAVAAKAS
jgi:polysaccharide deacetylase 2 family uncharacterized protein YibQ